MTKTVLSLSALVAAAGAAVAQPAIISFTYSELNGSFDAGTGEYQAVATSATSGDVTRLGYAPGSAEFDNGTLPGVDADAIISLSVTNIFGTTADGNGTITLTDANGDAIIADVDGTFRLLFGSIFFEGILSNAFFADNSSDGTFDGTSSGSFAVPTFLGPYSGSLVELFFNPGSFFANSFSNQTTLASGLLVPAPGAAALALMGGAIATRRRRA
jgi:hypothetical protein